MLECMRSHDVAEHMVQYQQVHACDPRALCILYFVDSQILSSMSSSWSVLCANHHACIVIQDCKLTLVNKFEKSSTCLTSTGGATGGV